MPKAVKTSLPTFNLRLGLPLFFGLLGVLVFLVLLFFEQRNYRANIELFTTETVDYEFAWAKRLIEGARAQGESEFSLKLIAEAELNSGINLVLLLDSQSRILGSSSAKATEQLPAFLDAVAQSKTEKNLVKLIQDNQVTAIAPITLGPKRTQGTFIVQYNLNSIKEQAWQHLKQQILIFAALMTLSGLLLVGLSRLYIFRPVHALLNSMRAIALGDFTPKTQLAGNSEFTTLEKAMQEMAATLNRNMQALADSEARFRHLSEVTFEAVFLHEDGIIVDANSATEKLVGVPINELIGRNIFEFLTADSRPMVQLRADRGQEYSLQITLQDAKGTPIPCEINVCQRSYQGKIQRIVAVRDRRQDLAAQAEIQRLAFSDPLTGLPNRHFLLERLTQELRLQQKEIRRAALITFNIDGFAAINDSLGMSAGDAVLRALAQRLGESLEQADTLARVEADTFAVLLVNLQGDLAQASLQASTEVEALLSVISQPLESNEQSLHLSAGAGIVMIPNDSQEPQELLREAETAMHLAKEQGQNQLRFFAHSLQEAANYRLMLRNDLKQALIAGNQLVLHYQPQMDANERLLGLEALVRWNHPTRGLISPADFIPEAEASGLIIPLGQWVLEEASACLKRLHHTAWGKNISMAINVSPKQFKEASFVMAVEAQLAQLGAAAPLLEIELTESVVADNLPATLEKMEQLGKHGIRFALDDFGTGYSSLSYLKHLPIHTLKIDRSFVLDIDAGEYSAHGKRPAVLIEAIVSMSHQLGLSVLAEGVETPAQVAWLTRSGCDEFQGYFFSRPLTEEQLWQKFATPNT